MSPPSSPARSTGAADGESIYGSEAAQTFMARVFSSCSDDPKGSVHRAWGLTLIFLVIFFVVSVFEMWNLKSDNGSTALMLAAIFTGITHLFLGILGTFVLKRFPTSFSVGFFLGILVILANQNLMLMATFHGYQFGSTRTNQVFANLGFVLFLMLACFAIMLYHFKSRIIVAPIDAKGLGGRSNSADYRQYQDQSS